MKKEMVKINGFNVTMTTENNEVTVLFSHRESRKSSKEFMFKLDKEQFEHFSNFGKRISGKAPDTIKATGKAVHKFFGTTECAPELAIHKEIYDGEVELQVINTITNNIVVATYTMNTSRGTRTLSFSVYIDINSNDIERLNKRTEAIQAALV